MSSWNKFFILKPTTTSRLIHLSTVGLTSAVACGLIQPSVFPINTAIGVIGGDDWMCSIITRPTISCIIGFLLGVTGFKLAEISLRNLLAICLSYQGWMIQPKSIKTKVSRF